MTGSIGARSYPRPAGWLHRRQAGTSRLSHDAATASWIRPKSSGGRSSRRRTELGLLVAASVIIVAAYSLMISGTPQGPTDAVPCCCHAGTRGVAHIANRIFAPRAIAVVLPIAFLLNGLGYVMILRIDLAVATSLRRYRPPGGGRSVAYVLTWS